MFIKMILVEVKGNTKEDLLRALQESIAIDLDLIGENGLEYTRLEAIDKGYSSTVEYIIDEVKDIEDDDELIEVFYNACFEPDPHYLEYIYSTLRNDDGNISAIAISCLCN